MNNLTFRNIKSNKECNKNVIKLYNEAFPKDEKFYALNKWIKIVITMNKEKREKNFI